MSPKIQRTLDSLTDAQVRSWTVYFAQTTDEPRRVFEQIIPVLTKDQKSQFLKARLFDKTLPGLGEK